MRCRGEADRHASSSQINAGAVGLCVYGIYMASCVPCYRFYMADSPNLRCRAPRAAWSAFVTLLCGLGLGESKPMLDIIYLFIGAAFLGACVSYAKVCEYL
jgi:hypothetical protein